MQCSQQLGCVCVQLAEHLSRARRRSLLRQAGGRNLNNTAPPARPPCPSCSGTVDNKGQCMALLEAATVLYKSGWKPKRTLLFV